MNRYYIMCEKCGESELATWPVADECDKCHLERRTREIEAEQMVAKLHPAERAQFDEDCSPWTAAQVVAVFLKFFPSKVK